MHRAVRQMLNPLNYPFLVLAASLFLFWISARVGASFRSRQRNVPEDEHEDFTFILGATLTLLGLIIGFTFSMAVTRYDQRKYFEEQEANAIGTEYVRADLLPAADAQRVRALLRSYLDHRILHYETRNDQQLRQIDSQTAQLQTEMWSAIVTPTAAQPTPVAALIVAGMNDVLNSQGYTQFAWRNRVPHAAWMLLAIIAVFCNLLVGYVAHGRSFLLFLILPIALSISFFLISDIDSPRGGLIHLYPQNLVSLEESLRPN
jgi:hypothetical protein